MTNQPTSSTNLNNKPCKENMVMQSQQSQDKLPPSKLTQLSQQLYNHVSTQLSEIRSSRAFYQKDCQLLLSPQRLHSMPSP